MTEQLCDFPVSKLARQKGFNEPCMYAYIDRGKPKEVDPIMGHNVFDLFEKKMKLEKRHPGTMDALRRRMENHFIINSERPANVYGRPTQALLARWLREAHGLPVWTEPDWQGIHDEKKITGYHYCMYAVLRKGTSSKERYDTSELAMESGLQEALNFLPDVNA